MRILYLTSSLSPYDGYGRYSRALVRGMGEKVHEVEVLGPKSVEKDFQSLRREAKGGRDGSGANLALAPELEAPKQYWRKKSSAIEAARIVRRHAKQADLVHCLVEPYYGIAGYAIVPPSPLPRLGQTALVLEVVGTYATEPFINPKRAPWGHKRAIERADCVVGISRYSLERLRAHVEPYRAEVVPLGVEDALFEEAKRRDPAADPTVLSVGAVKPRKGTLDLIEAAARLAPKHPRLNVHIVGDLEEDPGYAERCRDLIQREGLESQVLLRGRLGDREVAALARRAWCFALTSRNVGEKFEGLGLVFIEAAARGLPSVAARDCGAEEFVRHEETGLLAPQGDSEAIANALGRMIRDESLRSRLAANARDLAWCDFRWKRCLDRLEAIYREIAQCR